MWEKSTVFEILSEILDDLSEEDLKKFQNRLIGRDDEKKISRRYLEEVSREKTIEVMISHFQCSGALHIARETLDDIPRKDLAEKLTKLMKEAEARKTSSTEEKGKAKGDHRGGANGDHGGGAPELNSKQKELAPVNRATRIPGPLGNMAAENKGALVHEHLTATLQNLTEDQFEEFKVVLWETPVKQLVDVGDEYDDIPNEFQKDASREETAEELIHNLGQTHVLTAAATVMEKLGERDLAQDLRREAEALRATDPGPCRKPIRIATGKLHVAAGVVIGAGSVAAAAVAPLGAVLAVPLAGAVFGGYLIVKGIRSLFRKAKHV